MILFLNWQFLSRILGDELYENTNVDFSFNALDEAYKKVHLEMDWKRHLILIFKEAMQ